MNKGRQINVRKVPTQKRAELMVSRIHQATLNLLANEGLEYLSTKRIAKQAAISVGSLYQYYPNKQSIIYAIYREWLDHSAAITKDYSNQLELYISAEDWIKATLTAVYKNVLESSHTERKIDVELGRAMRLYPELNELEKMQGERVTFYLVQVARHFGSKWSKHKLNRLCLHAYRLAISFEEIYSQTEEKLEEKLSWHISAVSAVINLSLPK